MCVCVCVCGVSVCEYVCGGGGGGGEGRGTKEDLSLTGIGSTSLKKPKEYPPSLIPRPSHTSQFETHMRV